MLYYKYVFEVNGQKDDFFFLLELRVKTFYFIWVKAT